MAISDELKRWAKDRLSHDEQISIHPTKAITAINDALTNLSSAERKKNIEHAKAYADLYYQGRHNMDVPKEVHQSIQQLERRAERLNVVDHARQVVAAYGGPPTKETVAASLERSAQERAIQNAPATQTKTVDKGADLASVAANTLKGATPTIEKEWGQALRKGAGEAASARFQANLEGLNALRHDMLEKHPEWATKLPPPINVQEVAQRVAEQARAKQIAPMDQGISR